MFRQTRINDSEWNTYFVAPNSYPSTKTLYNPDSLLSFHILRICKPGLLALSTTSLDFFLKNIHYPFSGPSEVRMLPSNNLGRDGGSEHLTYAFLSEMSDLRTRVEVELEEIIPSLLEKRRGGQQLRGSKEDNGGCDLQQRAQSRRMFQSRVVKRQNTLEQR